MDRAQKVDKKNEVVRPVIMFTPSVMVIEMSKLFSAAAKDQSQFGQNI